MNVTGGGATTLLITTSSTTYLQGATATFTVAVTDAFNNPTADPGLSIALQVNGSPAETYTYTTTDGGVTNLQHVFGVVGTFPVSVTGGSFASNSLLIAVDLSSTTTSYQVVPRDLTAIVGASTQVTVTALNAGGMVNTNDNTSVGISFSDPKLNPLPAMFTNGVATVGFTWQTAGQQTITASGTSTAMSPPVTVTANTAEGAQVVWQPPAQVDAYAPFRIAAVIEDSYGNAVDPRPYTLSLTLMAGVGVLNPGYTQSVIGNTVFFDNISINGVTMGGILVVNGGPAVADSNAFDANISGGCSIGYVTPSGAGDFSGCSPANAASSIAAALAAVEKTDAPNATIQIAAGTYNEAVTLVNNRVLSGGWDAAFVAATPLATPTIIQPSGAPYAITVSSGTSTDVTLDGLVILAADITTGTSYAGIVQSGATLRVSRCVISGPFGAVDGEGGAWVVDDPVQATFEANWIASGGLQNGSASTSPRHGIVGNGGAGTVAVVSNTFVITDNIRGAAVEYSGTGDWSVTNNLIVGDFTSCSANIGVCAIADQFDGASINSAANNVIVETQAAAGPVYRTSGGTLLDANLHFGNFHGNVNVVHTGAPDTLFVSLAGADGFLYTMADNDWHVSVAGAFTSGVIDTDVNCGGSGGVFCGGDGRDIDGQLYVSGVGADQP